MTAPDPSPRPHLLPDPPDYLGEHGPEPEQALQYSPPAYAAHHPVYDDGSLESIWLQRATEHEAARRLRMFTKQAEEWKAAQHEAFLADAERALQRARIESDLAALTGQGLAQPPPSPSRDVSGAPSPGRHRDPDDVEDLGDDEPTATLDAAAAALFKVAPEVSRADLQTILQTNTYWAKKLHSARPRAER